jgi:hypothetical protein
MSLTLVVPQSADEFNAVSGRGDDVRPLMYGVHETRIHGAV